MPMTHDQLSELMSAYLDGEVDAREKALAEEVLRTDPAARRVLGELRQTVAIVGALPRHAAPPGLALELDAQLERRELLSGFPVDSKHSALRKAPWRASLRAAAMLALVLGAGWWILSRQQEKRPDALARSGATDTKKIEGTTATLSRPARPGPAIPAETLLAEGADPVVLVENSFEPEPIRLRVVARDAKERDALKKEFVTQLAQAKTENLARRNAASEKRREAGSFYLEGKPGVNFANVQERQVLVRVPHERVERLVDDVVSGAKISSEQLALQVGPAIVQGPDKARAMLQMMAQKDQPDAAVSDAPRHTPPTNLLNTLREAVGLGPVVKAPAGPHEDRTTSVKQNAAEGERTESSDKELLASDSTLPDATKNERASEVADSRPRSLVSKKLEAARAKQSEGRVGDVHVEVDAEKASSPPSASSTRPVSQFITLVVEFVVSESKPPASKGAGR